MQDRNEIKPFGIPQPPEKSCERCRNMNLECVFEPTFLGRPAIKRFRGLESRASGSDTIPSTMHIKDLLFSDTGEVGPTSHAIELPSKEALFQSMIEPHYFLSSILARDEAFGAHLDPVPPCWSVPLPDLVDDNTAISLERSLHWHRFFLPSMPSLIELRGRLTSHEFMSINSATKLLFSLLCLIALDIDQALNEQHPQLRLSIRTAVGYLGQDFIFSPPTHHDSVAVCLLLADYKPTVLATTKTVLHRAVKSETFIHLAHRIAHRLGEKFEQEKTTPRQLHMVGGTEFDAGFNQTVKHLQILVYDTFLDGYIAKSHGALRQALGKIMPVIDGYQLILEHRQCSPRTIFHIYWAISVCILLDALANLKEQWNDPGALFVILEQTEAKCVEEIKTSNAILKNSSGEIMAVRLLLELRFNSVLARIWGLGLLYAAVLKARSVEGRIRWEDEIESHEAIQISDQVRASREDVLAGAAQPFAMVLSQLGVKYPEKLRCLLEMFLECTNLKLGDVKLRPPLQHVALEILTHCKNLTENNIVHLKCFGRLNPNFENQLELFETCRQRFDSIVAVPWISTEVAYANGCVYSACSKMIGCFCELMKNLKDRILKESEKQKFQDGEERQGLDMSNMFTDLSEELFIDLNTSNEAWNIWPYVGGFGPLSNPQELCDWIDAPETNLSLGMSNLF
ncbi:hypothetical protein N7537_003014 [Penicillium hordei]|uniref:Uncharacterized protein n=1 Tax=Penicillium hordei TaxID=40994 RepID=A0AAD6EIK6_9EURO|nr:uncharacterized protein N7537_003014 [Penicillium hordei]KAJ5617900.1 hypothetical protein N7537_003014 [Penicillium hordei]